MIRSDAERRERRKSGRARGQALVEFALIIPILLLILGGILDFGFMWYSRLTLINATREAARWAVVQPAAQLQSIPTDLNSSSGHVAVNLHGLTWGSLTNPINIQCIPDPMVTSNTACDFAAGGARDPRRGDSIRIATEYAYSSFYARAIGLTPMLRTQVQMVFEVPTT